MLVPNSNVRSSPLQGQLLTLKRAALFCATVSELPTQIEFVHRDQSNQGYCVAASPSFHLFTVISHLESEFSP